MDTITIYVDGGCHNNGSPEARSYGSIAVVFKGELKRIERWEFSKAHTNNEAEYGALLASFRYLEAEPKRLSFPILIKTDSQLVYGQVVQGWKVKADNLVSLMDVAKTWLSAHENVQIQHVPRDEIVKVIGH